MQQRYLPVIALAVVVGTVLGITRTRASTTLTSPITTAASVSAVTTSDVVTPMTDRHGRGLQRIADDLGMSVEDVQKELDAGKKLYAIAAEHGMTATKLQEKKLADADARLKDMVSTGFLTQEQADKALTQLKERAENEVMPFGGLGFGGRHHGFGGFDDN